MLLKNKSLPGYQTLASEEDQFLEEVRVIPALETELVPKGQVHLWTVTNALYSIIGWDGFKQRLSQTGSVNTLIMQLIYENFKSIGILNLVVYKVLLKIQFLHSSHF